MEQNFINKLNKKIEPKKDYGSDFQAILKFMKMTGKKEFDAVLSKTTEGSTLNVNNLVYKGKNAKAARNIINQESDFFSMESINYGQNDSLEGFTKYIVYAGQNEGNNEIKCNQSPVVRFDMGGSRPHMSNTITNKYFSNAVDYPHIHFCTLNSKDNKMVENALSLHDLKAYLQDLAGFKNDEEKYSKIEPVSDISENSYGMPYLDMKNNPEKYGISDFKKQAKDMIKKLDESISLATSLKSKKEKLIKNGKSITEINDELNPIRHELMEKIASVTLQENIKNFCSEKAKVNQVQMGE